MTLWDERQKIMRDIFKVDVFYSLQSSYVDSFKGFQLRTVLWQSKERQTVITLLVVEEFPMTIESRNELVTV